MKIWITALALTAALCCPALPGDGMPLDPRNQSDRIIWQDIGERFGPVPPVITGTVVGAVLRDLNVPYWQSVQAGYARAATARGVRLEARAAENGADQNRQAVVADEVLMNADVLLVSPQSIGNLEPVVLKARQSRVPTLSVGGEVSPGAGWYVGNIPADSGLVAAGWFIENFPDGGAVAVIEGRPEFGSPRAWTDNFSRGLAVTRGRFTLVNVASGENSRQQAKEQAHALLRQHPNLRGIFCHTDLLALGAMDAVREAGRLGETVVVGAGGTPEVYESILRGEIAATVDPLPAIIGEVAVDVALRVLAGQEIPRVVITPQVIVTKDTASQYRNGDPATLQRLLAE